MGNNELILDKNTSIWKSELKIIFFIIPSLSTSRHYFDNVEPGEKEMVG